MKPLLHLLLALGLGTGFVFPSSAEEAHHPNQAAEHGHSENEHDPDDGHEHQGEHDHEAAESELRLTPEQLTTAGVVVTPLEPRPLAEEIEAPGEVQLDQYATSQVTPRIEAQVVARLARMGDKVRAGQPLVVLSSAEMAEAQGQLIIAARDWERLRKLSNEMLSEQQRLAARVAYQQAWAKLLAFGMTREQVQRLARTGDVKQADGRFSLLSPQDGTIIRDPFVVGQMVEPGDLLFEITDESKIWVEAHVNPELMDQVRPGAPARIQAGGRWYPGKVLQIHHTLDETTRTMGVRLEIPDPGDHLHPGQFVTARITVGRGEPVLSVPLEAVVRSPDGDWQLFVEKAPGEFEPVEVQVVRQLPGRVVIAGIEPGTRVVTAGAFFLQSELAKSGFAVHNH